MHDLLINRGCGVRGGVTRTGLIPMLAMPNSGVYPKSPIG